jgi:hypothetical protein
MPTLHETLPAHETALAWLNTFVATGTDAGHPQTYRNVGVEFFPNAVVFVASDRSMLLSSTVMIGNEALPLSAPSIDEIPDASYVVMDRAGRMGSLMRWMLRDAKAAEKEDRELAPITIDIRSGERPSVPTLSPELDRQIMVVTTERERLVLDLYDGAFISWRPMLAKHTPEPTDRVAFSPMLLARLGKLRGIAAGIEFELAGAAGGARFFIDCEPPIEGLLMPVRNEEPTEPAEVA